MNTTAMTYTFLCEGCLSTALDTIDPDTTTTGVLGWALSTSAVTDPTDSGSTLTYHSAGFGEYGVTLADAQSASYASWAGLASNSTTGSSGSNGTSSSGSGSGSSGNSTSTPTVYNSTYDYIVAGAGAAGIIVAQRLAESGASVLLIDRGDTSLAVTGGQDFLSWNNSITPYDMPSLGYYLSDISSTGDAYCTDTASEAGCILGGSTMINALMYVKPQQVDFDDKWPTGWKWSDVEADAARLYERNPGTITPSADGKRYDQGVSPQGRVL